jgi:hypothetical protein
MTLATWFAVLLIALLGAFAVTARRRDGSIWCRMPPVAALVATLLLILIGFLACALGALIFASIDTSDTSTKALVEFGLMFALPGVAAVGAGIWLLYRRSARS